MHTYAAVVGSTRPTCLATCRVPQDGKQIFKFPKVGDILLTAIGLDLQTLTFWEIKGFSTKPPKS